MKLFIGSLDTMANSYNKSSTIKTNFENFFGQAPQLNPKASRITGVIYGYRIEEIEHPLMKKVRYLDKLIDELVNGKTMKNILRK